MRAAMFIILILVLLVGALPSKGADSSFILRYDMPIGKEFTYRVTTDQFLMPKIGIRLHSLIMMDIVGRDENSFLICQMRMASDTNFDKTDLITYRPMGEMDFGGHRLYTNAGFLELLMDEYGNLKDNKAIAEDAAKSPSISTQYERITDASSLQGNSANGANGPYMLQLLMPTVPEGENIVLGKTYLDTVTFISRSVHLPTSYGASGVVHREILHDTVIRYMLLDSVSAQGAISVGHMTIKSERRNALGGRFESASSVVRDMRTGMIQHIREKCYRIARNGDRKVNYYATAELVDTQSSRLTKVSQGLR